MFFTSTKDVKNTYGHGSAVKAALGWARAAVTRAELGNADFCVCLMKNVKLKLTAAGGDLPLTQTENWQVKNPLFVVVRLTLVRSFLAFSSLSISTFWALAGRIRVIHECLFSFNHIEQWGRSTLAYLEIRSKSPLTSHEGQTCLLGSWSPVHLYCRTEWASRKC